MNLQNCVLHGRVQHLGDTLMLSWPGTGLSFLIKTLQKCEIEVNVDIKLCNKVVDDEKLFLQIRVYREDSVEDSFEDLIGDRKNGIVWERGDPGDSIMVDSTTNHLKLSFQIPSSGTFRLAILKRTEAEVGRCQISYLQTILPPDCIILPSRPFSNKSIHFYGDSITTGSCNQDAYEDQWLDRSTHNTLLAYSNRTSEILNWSNEIISQSGIGLENGWKSIFAREFFDWNDLPYILEDYHGYPPQYSHILDKSLLRLKSGTRIRYSGKQLDKPNQASIVCILFGENDHSYTEAMSIPFPMTFGMRLEEYIRKIIQFYGEHVPIIVMRGGMIGTSKNLELIRQWEDTMETLSREFPNLHSFRFMTCSETHPRCEAHESMAKELVEFIKSLKV